MTSGQSVPALRADRLGKRYGHVWALRDCTFSVPAGSVVRIRCQAGCPGASAGSVLPVTGHLGDYVLSVERSGGELVVTYLPADRFWTEQLIQGGLFLAIAVITLGAAIWLLHRRTT